MISSKRKIERYIKYTGFVGGNSEIGQNETTEIPIINKDSYNAEDIKRDSTDPWGGQRGNNQYFISNALNFLDSITTDFDVARFYNTTVNKTSGNNNISKFTSYITDRIFALVLYVQTGSGF